MKRFFTNTAVKFLAFCLAALFSVGAVMLAFCAVNFADQGCVPGQRYEDSAAYRSILSGYIISAANLYRMQGEDLETSGLSFVDQQERQARREELEQDLAGKVSNFRFEIRTADGKAARLPHSALVWKPQPSPCPSRTMPWRQTIRLFSRQFAPTAQFWPQKMKTATAT